MADVFPFIVGSGRSGTTLLRALLDAHPELAIPPESYFVVSLARRSERYQVDGRFDVEALAADVTAHPRFERWGLPGQELRDKLVSAGADGYPAAIRAVYQAYADHRGKPRYGDKTPKYVKDIARLAELFPESRFVHIVRDGRDVVLSFKDLGWGPDSAIESALRWRNWVELGRDAARDIDRERYLEIRYEDLAADPAQVLRQVCEFIALPFSEQMFEYTERADEIIGANYYPEGHGRIRLPPTSGLRDWRTQMDREDLVKFELVAGDLLDRLGYERAVPKATAKRRREADDEQLEGAPAEVDAGADVELDPELGAVIEEMNFLRRRAHKLYRRTRRFSRERDRLARVRAKEQRIGAREKRRLERSLEKSERKRRTAVRRRKKVERTLAGLEATRWWRTRLRLKRMTRPFSAMRARQRLR